MLLEKHLLFYRHRQTAFFPLGEMQFFALFTDPENGWNRPVRLCFALQFWERYGIIGVETFFHAMGKMLRWNERACSNDVVM